MFDELYGYYFRLDKDGISVCERSGGSELKVAQGSWNLDVMDGSGNSTINFSQYVVSNGGIPHIVDLKYSHLILVIDT